MGSISGFVLVEAAQNNLFLISSDCKNGLREILNTNGERGLMFKTNQKSALYSKILEYLELKEKQDKVIFNFAKKYCKRKNFINIIKLSKTNINS